MSIAICYFCEAMIDTDEHEYTTTPGHNIVCETCSCVPHCSECGEEGNIGEDFECEAKCGARGEAMDKQLNEELGK
jgi:hypothetical protein